MKTAAYLSILLAAGGLSAAAFAGCSSDPAQTTPAETDAGDDTDAVVDSAKPDTAKPDTGPYTCQAPLSSSFKCQPPADRAGKDVCTDLAISEIAAGCFGTSASSAKCNAAQAAHKACSTCMLSDWLTEEGRIDMAACMQKIAPSDTCGTTVQCVFDCVEEVCLECDQTDGSGKTASTSEYDDCVSEVQRKGGTAVPKGACYDIAAKDYGACATKPEYAPCNVRAAEDLLTFFRGACRDKADWSKSNTPDGTLSSGDAGTDGGDGGSDAADTSVDDAADSAMDDATDSATDDATDAATDDATDSATDDATDSATDDATDSATDDATDSATADAADAD